MKGCTLIFCFLLFLVAVDARKYKKRDKKEMKRRIKICGSDGNTYENMCQLFEAKCTNAGELYKAYNGECRANLTDNLIQPNDKKRQKKKRADDDRLVCGSDGMTYVNKCDFNKARFCKKVKFLHVGKCGGNCREADVCPMQVKKVEKFEAFKKKRADKIEKLREKMERKNNKNNKRVEKLKKKLEKKVKYLAKRLKKFLMKGKKRICASNGHTYQSKCDFMIARCKQHATDGTILKSKKCKTSN